MGINIRAWLKSKKNIFKIVSDSKKGTLKIFDKKGKILYKKTKLSKDDIKKVEENFSEDIAKKLEKVKDKKTDENYDPMIS